MQTIIESLIQQPTFRFEETNEQSTNCKQGEKCIGGLARATTVIKQLMRARKNTNPIYLNAGDNFQGTFWYTVGRWNVTSYFLNKLKADAIVSTTDFHNVNGGKYTLCISSADFGQS